MNARYAGATTQWIARLEGEGDNLMSAPTKAPAVAVGFSAGLGVLILLFYALTLATLADLLPGQLKRLHRRP